MARCNTFGCDRELDLHYHCCRLCFEAQRGGYPVDEHTPECDLRHAAHEDPVVAKWVAIYDQVVQRFPRVAESWRHLKRRFYGTDVGVLERSEWGMICAQLQNVRRGEGWLRIVNAGGLNINLETGETNMPDSYPDFKVKFPEGGSNE